MKACTIEKSPIGEIVNIYDLAGNPSRLFNELKTAYSGNKTTQLAAAELAARDWEITRSAEFKSWWPNADYDVDATAPEPTMADIQTFQSQRKAEVLANIQATSGLVTKTATGYIDAEGNEVARTTKYVEENINKKYNFNPAKKSPEEQERQQIANAIASTKGIIHHKWMEFIFDLAKEGKTEAQILKQQNDLLNKVYEATKDEVEAKLKEAGIASALGPKDSKAYFALNKVYKNKVQANFFPNLAKGVIKLYTDIKQRAEFNGGAANMTILQEQVLYSKSKNRAGTTDLVVVYGNGVVDFYDYKFIDFGYNLEDTGETYQYYKKGGAKVDGKVKAWRATKDTLANYKYEQFNLQLRDYSEMIAEMSNDQIKLGQVRIIPIGVKRGFAKPEATTEELVQSLAGMQFMEMDTAGTIEYLGQIALDIEMSDNAVITKFSKQLQAELNKLLLLNEKYKGGNADLENRIKQLRKTINELKTTKNITGIVDYLAKLVQFANSSQDKLSPNELMTVKEIVSFYTGIVELAGNLLEEQKLSPLYKGKINKADIIAKARIVHSEVSDWLANIDSVLLVKLSQATGKEVDAFTQMQQEMNWADSFVKFSQIDNELIASLRDVIMSVEAKTTAAVDKLIKEAEAIKKEVEAADGLEMAYNLMADKQLGKLVPKYKVEKFVAEENARMIGDSQYFIDNYKVFDEAKFAALYADRKTREENRLKLIHLDDQATIAKLMEKWEKRNDLLNHPKTAMTVKWNSRYIVPKEPEKFYSEQYKLIAARPAVAKLYDFYIKNMYAFSNMLGANINGTFIPDIRKSMVESAFVNQDFRGTLRNAKEEFFNSISMRTEEMAQGFVDENGVFKPNEYDKTPHIPIYFMDNRLTPAEKSYDLLKSLVMFGNMAIKHKNLKEQEEIVRTMRVVMANRDLVPVAKTGMFGQVLKDATTGEPTVNKEDTTALQLFDTFVNYYLYGQRLQNKDSFVKNNAFGLLDDRVYSKNRVLAKMLSFFSVKSLSGNFFSAVPGAINAGLNGLFEGANGRFYNNKQYGKGLKMWTFRKPEAVWALAYIRAEDDNWVQQAADKLSMSKVEEYASMDMFYFAQKADRIAVHSITLAMMQNYTIKNGKLAKVKEGDKSLLDLVQEKDGQMYIEGMTPDLFIKFRNYVKYAISSVKGSASESDISAINTHIFGRALMQYRRWITPMVQERFRDVTYTREIDQVEIGRYRVFWEQLITENFTTSLSQLGGLLADVALGWTGVMNPLFRDNMAYKRWEMFKLSSPDHPMLLELARKQKGKSPEEAAALEQELFLQYQLARNGQIKAFIVEARTITAILLLAMLLGSEWADDDDDEDGVHKKAIRYLDRLYDEMSFFYNPFSVTSILKSPIPLITSITSVLLMTTNFTDEILDYMFGEMQTKGKNKGRYEREKNDQTPPFHYFSRLFPILGNLLDELEDFETPQRSKKNN